MRIASLAAVLLMGALAFAVFLDVRKQQRNVLWQIVQVCVADQRENGRPRPCSYVSLVEGEQRGYVVLKDPLSRAQLLVMPTRRIAGIESAEILSADAPNYWQAAWQSRSYAFTGLHRKLARNDLGLAVNSSPDRSQDQLHIHVDCVRPSVKQEVGSHVKDIGNRWKRLGFSLAGRRYFARRIEAPSLRGLNPFRLLADWVASNGGAMWRETLVAVGVTFPGHRDGFVLLAGSADPQHRDPGHGESLLDHTCALETQ